MADNACLGCGRVWGERDAMGVVKNDLLSLWWNLSKIGDLSRKGWDVLLCPDCGAILWDFVQEKIVGLRKET